METAITCLKPSDGGLHLGHWIGNIQPLISHQYDYDCVFIFADLQASNLGSQYALRDNVELMLKQLLALGVDPSRVTFYLESQLKKDKIKEFVLLSDYVSNNRINRLPVFKSQSTPIKMSMYLFPVLQMLDFYLTGASVAFSNVDNKAVIELTNETFKRINRASNLGLKHVDLIHGTVDMLVGFDNQKMSKAKNNCIFFHETLESIKKKVNKMYTDPSRIHSNTPGNVDNNVVFKYFNAFLPTSEYNVLVDQYQQGTLSDSNAKKILVGELWNLIENCQAKINLMDCSKLLAEMGL